MKKMRQANLELLRMICMMMVITMHLLNHGKLLEAVQPGSLSYYIVWTLFGGSFVSITIYLLISGYFLAETRFSVRKLARLGGQVFFYAFGITMLFWIFGGVEKDLRILVYSLLPISSDFYWFISIYVGMYLFSPVLNHLIRSLTKRQLECVLALSFLLVSVWPNLIYFSSALNTAGGVSISWFLTAYLFGAYLRLYDSPDGKFGKKALGAAGVTLLIPASRFLIEALLQTPLSAIPILEDLMWGFSVFYNYDSILVSAAAFLWFRAFLNLKIPSGRLANGIVKAAGAAFGVYLIHDHYYIRESLWPRIGGEAWVGKWYLPLAILGVVIGLYAVCACIELLRQLLFRPLERSERLQGFLGRMDEKLLRLWRGK